jgi:hypothetical protein
MIIRVKREYRRGNMVVHEEFEVIFPDGKRVLFRVDELVLVSRATKK